jgi:hypothetical protein
MTTMPPAGIHQTSQPAAMNQEVAIDDQEPVQEESLDSSIYGDILPPNSIKSESRGYLSVRSKPKSKNLFLKDKNKPKSGKANNDSFDMAPRSSIS